MIKILFVCHGNICRSVMAEYIMRYMVEQAGLAGEYVIDSAAATTEEIGNEMYPPAKRKLDEKGIPYGHHRARKIVSSDYNKYDYLIGMDEENIFDMKDVFGDDNEGKIYKLMSFAGKTKDVADPWYTRDFEATYRDLCEGIRGFMASVQG